MRSQTAQVGEVAFGWGEAYLYALVWGVLNVSGVNFNKPNNSLQVL